MATKIDRITLKKNLILTYIQKTNFTPSFFEILQIQYKLVVLGTFRMTGYGHRKKRYKLVENFHAYLHAKNQVYSSLLSLNVADMLEACYVGSFRDA